VSTPLPCARFQPSVALRVRRRLRKLGHIYLAGSCELRHRLSSHARRQVRVHRGDHAARRRERFVGPGRQTRQQQGRSRCGQISCVSTPWYGQLSWLDHPF
jgi:hypothetical protein